jgi:transposase
VAHRTARLNEYGRQLLVQCIVREGWTVPTAAKAQGVSRATGHKWVRRFRDEGVAGLADRSSRPHRSPQRTSSAEVDRIVRARTELRWGPDRLGPLLGHPVSTVAAVLRRARMPRLADLDRPTGCRSAATRSAIRVGSFTRITRSSAGSPTAVATVFGAEPASPTARSSGRTTSR